MCMPDDRRRSCVCLLVCLCRCVCVGLCLLCGGALTATAGRLVMSRDSCKEWKGNENWAKAIGEVSDRENFKGSHHHSTTKLWPPPLSCGIASTCFSQSRHSVIRNIVPNRTDHSDSVCCQIGNGSWCAVHDNCHRKPVCRFMLLVEEVHSCVACPSIFKVAFFADSPTKSAKGLPPRRMSQRYHSRK